MIVDQNILLEYYLNDNLADECEQILDALADDTSSITGYLTSYHLNGTRAILNHYNDPLDAVNEIEKLEKRVQNADGLSLFEVNHNDAMQACNIVRTDGADVDFDDALVIHAADVLDTTILSIDSDFRDNEKHFDYNIVGPKEIAGVI